MKLAKEVEERNWDPGVDALSEEDRMISAYTYHSMRGSTLIETAWATTCRGLRRIGAASNIQASSYPG
jgi:hypothetical protein